MPRRRFRSVEEIDGSKHREMLEFKIEDVPAGTEFCGPVLIRAIKGVHRGEEGIVRAIMERASSESNAFVVGEIDKSHVGYSILAVLYLKIPLDYVHPKSRYAW